MSWWQVATIVGSLALLFVWAHSDLSKDIGRVEAQVETTRAEVSRLQDENRKILVSLAQQLATRSE